MRRVARDVGITPMALYRHYADRDGPAQRPGRRRLCGAGRPTCSHRALPATSTSASPEILDLYLDHALRIRGSSNSCSSSPARAPAAFPRTSRPAHLPPPIRMTALIQEGMQSGHFRKDDPWAITFEIGALLQGLVMLYLGGRMAMSPARFRAFCRRSFRRYLNGIRNLTRGASSSRCWSSRPHPRWSTSATASIPSGRCSGSPRYPCSCSPRAVPGGPPPSPHSSPGCIGSPQHAPLLHPAPHPLVGRFATFIALVFTAAVLLFRALLLRGAAVERPRRLSRSLGLL